MRSEIKVTYLSLLLAAYELLRSNVVDASPINYSIVPDNRLSDGLLFTCSLLLVQGGVFLYWALSKKVTGKSATSARLALLAIATALTISGLFGLYLLSASPLLPRT